MRRPHDPWSFTIATGRHHPPVLHRPQGRRLGEDRRGDRKLAVVQAGFNGQAYLKPSSSARTIRIPKATNSCRRSGRAGRCARRRDAVAERAARACRNSYHLRRSGAVRARAQGRGQPAVGGPVPRLGQAAAADPLTVNPAVSARSLLSDKLVAQLVEALFLDFPAKGLWGSI